jgi:hypothetical protein
MLFKVECFNHKKTISKEHFIYTPCIENNYNMLFKGNAFHPQQKLFKKPLAFTHKNTHLEHMLFKANAFMLLTTTKTMLSGNLSKAPGGEETMEKFKQVF